jgi:hypothetical protein
MHVLLVEQQKEMERQLLDNLSDHYTLMKGTHKK